MKDSRNNLYDGLKFLLIVLVTIGHFSEPYRYTHSMIGAGYSVIYLFHMPLFILLSGYFSKHITFGKIKKSFYATWEAYLVMALACIVLSSHSWYSLIIPSSSYWYLIALIVWKIVYYLLGKILHKNSVILLLSIAMVPISMLLINKHNEVFSIMRAICFFPFFMIGTMLSEGSIRKIKSYRIFLAVLAIIIFILIMTLSSRYIHELEWHRKGVFQLNEEYGYSVLSIFLCTLLIYGSSLITILSMLTISKLPYSICQYGRYSLTFYVLQDISWNLSKNYPDLSMPAQYSWCILTVLLGILIVNIDCQNLITHPFSHVIKLLSKNKNVPLNISK